MIIRFALIICRAGGSYTILDGKLLGSNVNIVKKGLTNPQIFGWTNAHSAHAFFMPLKDIEQRTLLQNMCIKNQFVLTLVVEFSEYFGVMRLNNK